MSGLGKILVEGFHILMHQGVVVEHDGECPQFGGRGQAPVDQQVRCFLEGRFFGQFLHGDAAVSQDPLLTLHKGDLALAGPCVGEAGIQGDESGSAAQLCDINCFFTFTAHDHR